MSRNRKDWVDKLIDALWVYRIAFNALLGMSPYRVVYGKPCHLSVKIAIKMLSYDLTKAGGERRLQLSELKEIRV